MRLALARGRVRMMLRVAVPRMLLMFGTMGTAPSSATAKYLNGAKVPHLFLISSASKWNDPVNQPLGLHRNRS